MVSVLWTCEEVGVGRHVISKQENNCMATSAFISVKILAVCYYKAFWISSLIWS
jgi:hypothetical protein